MSPIGDMDGDWTIDEGPSDENQPLQESSAAAIGSACRSAFDVLEGEDYNPDDEGDRFDDNANVYDQGDDVMEIDVPVPEFADTSDLEAMMRVKKRKSSPAPAKSYTTEEIEEIMSSCRGYEYDVLEIDDTSDVEKNVKKRKSAPAPQKSYTADEIEDILISCRGYESDDQQEEVKKRKSTPAPERSFTADEIEELLSSCRGYGSDEESVFLRKRDDSSSSPPPPPPSSRRSVRFSSPLAEAREEEDDIFSDKSEHHRKVAATQKVYELISSDEELEEEEDDVIELGDDGDEKGDKKDAKTETKKRKRRRIRRNYREEMEKLDDTDQIEERTCEFYDSLGCLVKTSTAADIEFDYRLQRRIRERELANTAVANWPSDDVRLPDKEKLKLEVKTLIAKRRVLRNVKDNLMRQERKNGVPINPIQYMMLSSRNPTKINGTQRFLKYNMANVAQLAVHEIATLPLAAFAKLPYKGYANHRLLQEDAAFANRLTRLSNQAIEKRQQKMASMGQPAESQNPNAGHTEVAGAYSQGTVGFAPSSTYATAQQSPEEPSEENEDPTEEPEDEEMEAEEELDGADDLFMEY